MSSENYQIKAGDVINFSRGSYSDYGIEAHMVFRRDCDLEELAREFAKEKRPDAEADSLLEFTVVDFVAWLVIKGWAVDFDTREIHTGDYGELEIGDVRLGWDVEEWRY